MKGKRGKGGKAYENRRFSRSGSLVPPNPFSRALCSTSDPDSEAPSTRLRNSSTHTLRCGYPALVVGLAPQTVLGVPTTGPLPSVSAGYPGRSRNGHGRRSSPGLEQSPYPDGEETEAEDVYEEVRRWEKLLTIPQK
jgi:hypothetical protein